MLHLDWIEPNPLDDALVERIERLARVYAGALTPRPGGNDKRLDDLLNLRDLGQELDYHAILELFADATGSDAGSMLLNRPGESARYWLKASLLGPGLPLTEAAYEPGQGLTGWVLQQNPDHATASAR